MIKIKSSYSSMPIFYCAAILLAVLLSVSQENAAFALERTDFYTSEALVTDEKSEARLIRETLINVLIKQTGQAAIGTDPRIIDILAQQDELIVSESYRDKRSPANRFAEPDRYLRVTFNPARLDTLMRAAGLDLWGLERPDTLIWLALEDPQTRERRMLQSDDPMLAYAMQTAADQRALPLILPIQDQTDFALVDAQRIWSGNYDDAVLASERYAADQTLLGAASKRNDLWQVRWRLIGANGLKTYTTQSPELADALHKGIERTADITASGASINTASDTRQMITVRLTELTLPEDFLRGYRALQGLSQVDNARISNATDDLVEITLNLSADRNWLEQAITLHDDLALVNQEGNQPFRRNQMDALEVTVLPE